MNLLSIAAVGLFSVATSAHAQQGVTKPVIPVPPAAAPAIPVAQNQPPSPSTTPVPVPASYVLGAEDIILVSVWKEPSLTGGLTIRPDGMISLPLLGDVPAAGLTPMMLGEEIARRLKKYITDPLVTVTVTGVNSKHIFLLGEIAHIGPLALTPDMNILQAISTAGGLTPYANSKHIYILRGPQGKQQKIRFDYKKAVKNGDMQGIVLMPGDTIYVPQ
jgi:polysaccharide export outer membrane protein